MDDIKKLFGIRVKTMRKSLGLSQEKMGDLARLDRTYIADIERGKRNVSLHVIQKISIAFNTSISELLKDIDLQQEKNNG